MKATNFKTLCAIISVGLLSAATFISSQSPTSALAFEKKQGQDVKGKNCERVDTKESSTFGKCENVCKDKEVTRDAANNRWVCNATKTVTSRPGIGNAPVLDTVKDPGAKTPSKHQPQTGSKTGKAKQN
ncbi:MAG TPA: hypothetical protein VJ810_42880 [Blastocatellia bacterium]|nr:hypothetical protein [Blastocatellia bacterium]